MKRPRSYVWRKSKWQCASMSIFETWVMSLSILSSGLSFTACTESFDELRVPIIKARGEQDWSTIRYELWAPTGLGIRKHNKITDNPWHRHLWCALFHLEWCFSTNWLPCYGQHLHWSRWSWRRRTFRGRVRQCWLTEVVVWNVYLPFRHFVGKIHLIRVFRYSLVNGQVRVMTQVRS